MSDRVAKRRRTIREDAFNIPNLLSMFRVFLIPVVLWLISDGTPRANFWAAIVYSVSATTDFVDGWLARRYDWTSIIGKFLDPLADKLLVMASLVTLTAMGRAPAWVVSLIVARELAVTSLRVIAMGEGLTIAARQGGKDKAALQMVAILMLIVHHRYDVWFGFLTVRASFHEVGLTLLYLSAFFAITSAVDYFALFVRAVEQEDG